MSYPYPGNPASFPAVELPSDGDAKPAASVAAGLEGLADRTASLNAFAGKFAQALIRHTRMNAGTPGSPFQTIAPGATAPLTGIVLSLGPLEAGDTIVMLVQFDAEFIVGGDAATLKWQIENSGAGWSDVALSERRITTPVASDPCGVPPFFTSVVVGGGDYSVRPVLVAGTDTMIVHNGIAASAYAFRTVAP